jgi:hypothetical protein
VIASDYQPHSGAASWWQRYVLIFKRGPDTSLLHLCLVFALCSPHQHMSPLHTSRARLLAAGNRWLPIPVHATYDIVTQRALTVASEKSARGATLASWQQSHGSGGIVLMS